MFSSRPYVNEIMGLLGRATDVDNATGSREPPIVLPIIGSLFLFDFATGSFHYGHEFYNRVFLLGSLPRFKRQAM